MSMETVYAGTVEQLSGFVLQVGFAGAVVLTLVFLAASEFDGAVFASVLRWAFTAVSCSAVQANSVNTRPENNNISNKIKNIQLHH